MLTTRTAASALLVLAGLALGGCGGGAASQDDKDQAVAEAQRAYGAAKSSGADLEPGPCISQSLSSEPDWAVDIAHDPRTDVDDQPANQCQSFRDGKTHHFVELTPEGELIRAE